MSWYCYEQNSIIEIRTSHPPTRVLSFNQYDIYFDNVHIIHRTHAWPRKGIHAWMPSGDHAWAHRTYISGALVIVEPFWFNASLRHSCTLSLRVIPILVFLFVSLLLSCVLLPPRSKSFGNDNVKWVQQVYPYSTCEEEISAVKFPSSGRDTSTDPCSYPTMTNDRRRSGTCCTSCRTSIEPLGRFSSTDLIPVTAQCCEFPTRTGSKSLAV